MLSSTKQVIYEKGKLHAVRVLCVQSLALSVKRCHLRGVSYESPALPTVGRETGTPLPAPIRLSARLRVDSVLGPGLTDHS